MGWNCLDLNAEKAGKRQVTRPMYQAVVTGGKPEFPVL